MATKDEAMRIALEALGTVREWEVVDYDPLENAIAVLRQALEQPEQEPVAYTTRTGMRDGRLVPRPFQFGDTLPAVGSYCLVSGANCDIESDQHRGYSWRQVLGYSDDKEFVCLQTHKDSYACWPTVERLTNCWFAEIPHPIHPSSQPRQQAGEPTAVSIHYVKLKSRKKMKATIPSERWGWWIDVCPGERMYLRDATVDDLARCIRKAGDERSVEDFFCELSEKGALVSKEAVDSCSTFKINAATPPSKPMTGWQPIETAPKTGRELILLLTPSLWPQLAYSNTWWLAGFSVETNPTHWMPIPAIETKHGIFGSLPND